MREIRKVPRIALQGTYEKSTVLPRLIHAVSHNSTALSIGVHGNRLGREDRGIC